MNPAILDPEVQQYIRSEPPVDPVRVALQKSPFIGIQPAELAQQVESRQRCRKKLPLWYGTPGIYYPPRLSIEQASSEATALYKSQLVSPSDEVIDLTGGFGVDSYYLAKRAKAVMYCEQNDILAPIARHNFKVLGAANITTEAVDGVAHLQRQPDDAFDCLYIDPARRKNHQKTFLFSDCEPDVTAWQDLLLQKAGKVLIKASPLLDITQARQTLRHISEIYIISVGNECKELLFVLKRGFAGVPRLTAVSLAGNQCQTFSFTPDEEQATIPDFGSPARYLYEPDAALLKAGAFKSISSRYQLQKLHPNTHLYTGEARHLDFMGRVFIIDRTMPYAAFKKAKGSLKANVSARNFPLDTKALRGRHRIEDGGNLFLFFCTGPNNDLLVIFASKS